MNLFFEDARTFSKKCPRKYNLIIIDLFFADGIPEHLTTVEFYHDLRNCLNKNKLKFIKKIVDSFILKRKYCVWQLLMLQTKGLMKKF